MVVEVLRGGTGAAVSSGIKRFNLNGGHVVLSRSFKKNETTFLSRNSFLVSGEML